MPQILRRAANLKVFLSSVISGFEPYREAATEAVRALGYQVVRAEDFPASSNSPQVACLSGVRESDLVVLILSPRYGAVQPSGKSATHEEYDEVRGRKPLLVFVHEGAELEPKRRCASMSWDRWSSSCLRVRARGTGCSRTIGMGEENATDSLRPPLRTREQLRNEAKEIAEDLVHLLYRAPSPSRD